MMKRVLLHIAFWAAYIAQDILLQFSYMQRFLNGIPVTQQLMMGFKTSVLILIPKLLVTYFLLYISLKQVLSTKRQLFLSITGAVFIMTIGIVLFRVLYYYYINPVVYMGKENHPPLFSVMSLWLALLEVGFVAAIAVIIKVVRIQLLARKKERSLIREKLETELKFLKNQTNPHFLFNTLNNIYALARKKSDSTADVVMKLSKILRFMIYESGKPFITIAEETKLIEDYLDLERIRYNERLNISFKKEIDNESQHVSPLLLLPFVENAFKHGVSETRFTSFVNIDLKLYNGALNFSVENSKENLNSHSDDSKIGLCNVRRQLELMYKEFDLKVDDQDTTFRINLTINLNSHEKI